MGEVYEALDHETHRTVALKIVKLEGTGLERIEGFLRFRKEVDALASIRHPHVVQMLGSFEDANVVYFAMEKVDGETLAHRLLRAPLDVETALGFLRQACDALVHVHQRGVVHCDIKPANLMIDALGQVKIADFGISTLGRLQQAGASWSGTLRYLAPEQAGWFDGKLGPWTDVYALGATFYEALAGVPAFSGKHPEQVFLAKMREDQAPLYTLVPTVPRWLSELIASMLHPDPPMRPADAGVVAATIAEGRMGAPTVRIGAGSRHRAPLVGREAELVVLEQVLDDLVLHGASRLVLLGGESGIGKTRLAEEFRRRAFTRGATIGYGKCSLETRTIPYYSLTTAISEAIANVGEGLEPQQQGMWVEDVRVRCGAELRLAVPSLARALGAAAEDAAPESLLDPVARLSQSFDALIRFMEVFGERPRVWILDDVQWADVETLSFLSKFARSLPKGSLILAGYRTEAVADATAMKDWRADLPESVVDIALRPFSPEQTLQYFRMRFGSLPSGAQSMLDRIHLISEGIPFTLATIAEALVQLGAVTVTSKGTTFDMPRVQTALLTSTPEEFLWLELGVFGPEELRVLAQAALLAPHLDFGLLVSTEVASPEKVVDVLDIAVQRGVLVRTAKGYAFAHDKIREAISADIPAKDRAEHHRRAALALQTSTLSDAQFALADHWFFAGNTRFAYKESAVAARLAVDFRSYAMARRYYERCLDLAADTETNSDVPATHELRWELARVLILLGDTASAREHLLRGVAASGDSESRARIHVMLAEAFLVDSDLPQFVRQYDLAAKELGIQVPTTFGSTLFLTLATLAKLILRRDRVTSLAERTKRQVVMNTDLAHAAYYTDFSRSFLASLQASELAYSLAPCPEKAIAFGQQALLFSGVPALRGVTEVFRRKTFALDQILADSDKKLDPHGEGRIGVDFTIGLSYAGQAQWDLAIRHFESSLHRMATTGVMGKFFAVAMLNAALVYRFSGQPEKARAHCRRAERLGGDVRYWGLAPSFEARVLLDMGDLAAARQASERAQAAFYGQSNPLIDTMIARDGAYVHMAEGRWSDAQREFQTACDLAWTHRLFTLHTIGCFSGLIEAQLRAPRSVADRVRAAAQLRGTLWKAWMETRLVITAQPSYERAKAVMLAAAGRPARAERQFQKALATAREQRSVSELVQTARAFAEFLTQQGSPAVSLWHEVGEMYGRDGVWAALDDTLVEKRNFDTHH